MRKALSCGLFFITFLLLFLGGSFSEEASSSSPKNSASFDLEPLIITKSAVHLINPYSLKASTIEELGFDSPVEALGISPLDLESRSPKAGIQTDFSLRGSSFQGVLLLLDGQRINDPQTGHHNSDIPLTKEDLQRIDVIPGVGSSVFGPDAVGGAVNFILKRPEARNLIFESSGGQYRTRSGLFSFSEKKDGLGARLSLENEESAGFSEDTDFKKFTTSLASSLEIPDGEFLFNLGYLEKEFGARDFYTPGLGFLSKEWTKTYLLSTGLNLHREDFVIKPNFLWRRHFDKFLLDKTLKRSRYLNHHCTDVITPNVYFQKDLGYLGRAGLGLEAAEERINSTNLGKHRRAHKSLYLDEVRDFFHKLSTGFSFRMDDFEGFHNAYTGSASLRYNFRGSHSLYLGVSRSMRLPSFTELYYNDPTTIGNASLSPEKSLNYEAGYSLKKESLFLGATLFFRKERDFIDWVKYGLTQPKWQVENITRAEVFGIEGRFKLEINKLILLDTNYTYIDKGIDEQGMIYKYGPSFTRHLFNSELIFKLPFGSQGIGFTYKKKPLRDGWLLMNARLGWDLSKNIQLFARATNLLNVKYQEIEGIASPGRWVEAGLRLEW